MMVTCYDIIVTGYGRRTPELSNAPLFNMPDTNSIKIQPSKIQSST